MKRWFKEIRERGLSLRITFFVMLIVSLSVAAALLYTNFRTIKTFHSLADATDAILISRRRRTGCSKPRIT